MNAKVLYVVATGGKAMEQTTLKERNYCATDASLSFFTVESTFSCYGLKT